MFFFKKIIISLILFVIISPFSLKAEIVNKIEINGNSRVSDETIKVYGNILKVGSDYTQAKLDQILKDLYSTNFFKEIDVSIKNGILFIDVSEYPVISQLVISGEPSNKFKLRLKELLNLKRTTLL